MIRIDSSVDRLTAEERYGLEVLLDLSRVVPMFSPGEPTRVTGIEFFEEEETSLKRLMLDGWSIRPGEGVVRISRAALRWVTRVAGAGVEQESTQSDRYGRVPSTENPLVREGSERTAAVSRAAGILRDAVVKSAKGRLVRITPAWPKNKSWALSFTHDLDGVRLWPLFSGLRFVESMRKRKWALTADILSTTFKNVGGDPLGDGARALLKAHREWGTRSTWFVLCGTRTLNSALQGDLTYSCNDARFRKIVERVRLGGHEVGLHGSFATSENAAVFSEQKHDLEKIVEGSCEGVRQHFLRMRPGSTQRLMKAVGFEYDATYGFPDRNGYRLGAADVVPAWDAKAQRRSELDEVPFVWMDRALSKYRGIEDPAAWMTDARTLAGEIIELQEHFVCIWHPHLTDALGYPKAFREFCDLSDWLRSKDPYCAPLGEIVRWRRARRSIRAQGVDAEGRLRATMTVPWPDTVILLDERDSPQEVVSVSG